MMITSLLLLFSAYYNDLSPVKQIKNNKSSFFFWQLLDALQCAKSEKGLSS